MDIVEYPQSGRGYRYCLVMIDHFTKWLELFPLRNQKAETVARKVFDGEQHARNGSGRGPKKLGPIRVVVLFCIQHCRP